MSLINLFCQIQTSVIPEKHIRKQYLKTLFSQGHIWDFNGNQRSEFCQLPLYAEKDYAVDALRLLWVPWDDFLFSKKICNFSWESWRHIYIVALVDGREARNLDWWEESGWIDCIPWSLLITPSNELRERRSDKGYVAQPSKKELVSSMAKKLSSYRA